MAWQLNGALAPTHQRGLAKPLADQPPKPRTSSRCGSATIISSSSRSHLSIRARSSGSDLISADDFHACTTVLTCA